MLNCRACISRFVRTAFTGLFRSYHHTRPYHAIVSSSRRHFPLQVAQSSRSKPAFFAGHRDTELKGRDAVEIKSVPEFTKPQLEKELQYLKDPLRLAENTTSLLKNGEYEKAIEMVRLASRNTSCTVSWNHLIDYYMNRGETQKATKLYYEMKKRMQQPDSHTFTMLLRGFSWQSSRHPKRKPPVDLALKIYHSMSANNCPVKPNIIHTNAVLHICALAGDMDALWGVAAKLPQRGPGTPTNFTFTTILDAIRMSAWQSGNDLADQNVDETGMRRQESVIQGRRIWEEVISRWRAGELWIDEKLACSMGRLLLLGTVTQDFQDVLSLAEQVMGIPKRNAGWIEPSDTTRQPPAASYPVSQEIQPTDPTTSLTEPAHVSLDPPPSPSPPPTDLVRVFHSNPSKDPSNLTAQPGPNTLSLLLAAGINLRQPHNAQYYWNLLTSPTGPYKVAPDNENYHMYLRLLRLQHNSRLALQVVQDLVSQANDAPRKANAEDGAVMEGKKQGAVAAKTFRIALSCCVRDKNNPEAINHATELVRMMQETLTAPDIRSLGMYLDLGISQKKKDWRAVWHVCRHMRAPMELVKNGLNYGVQGAQGVSGLGTGWDMEEVRNLWKSYAGAVDSVLDLGREDLYNDSKKRKQVVGLMKWAQLMVVRWGKNRVRRKQGRGEEPGQLETEEQGLVEEGELEQADEKETERMRKVMGGWKKRMAAAGKAVRRRFEPEELKGFAEQ